MLSASVRDTPPSPPLPESHQAMGSYLARTLSYHGATFVMDDVSLAPQFRWVLCVCVCLFGGWGHAHVTYNTSVLVEDGDGGDVHRHTCVTDQEARFDDFVITTRWLVLG